MTNKPEYLAISNKEVSLDRQLVGYRIYDPNISSADCGSKLTTAEGIVKMVSIASTPEDAGFRSIADQLGGIYDYEQGSSVAEFLDELLRSTSERVAKGVRRGKPMNLTLKVIDRMDCNAWAYSDDSGDYIAIHRGLIETIPKVIRSLLLQSQFYPDVGDTSQLGVYRSDKTPAEIARDSTHWNVPPLNDPERRILANDLNRAALIYIFEHEMTHLYNGHTDWLGERSGLAAIMEVQTSANPIFSGIEKQTLEFDADSIALEKVLFYKVQPKLSFVQSIAVWDVSAPDAQGIVDRGIVDTLNATMVVHLLYASMTGLSRETFLTGSHPHPAVRMFSLTGGVSAIISHRTGERYLSRDEAQNRQLLELLDTFMTVFDNYDQMSAIFGNPDAITMYVEATYAYEAQWEKMHESLDRLKRGGRLAPARPTPPPAYPDHPDIKALGG